MAQQPDQQNRDFVPVESEQEALTLLRTGAKHAASTILWTPNQEKTLRSHFSALVDQNRALYFWLPTGFDPKAFNDEIMDKGYLEWFFSVSLPAANIFFKAKFSGIDSAGMRFVTPEKIFKVQRRKDFRFTIPDGYVLKIDFVDPLLTDKRMTQKVLDISAGGLSFVVRPDEAPLFPPGAVLNELTLRLRGKEVVCQAEVRHIRELPPNSRIQGVKVGIQFHAMPAGDTQVIASYVFEETRRFVSKML
ncbi:MAG TPA: PilZ domain-containing protein [Bdellovibrionota bacterium]|jgi:hypothetical protein|nr:PilZ domain-containing protein [Bdellovibrionota bacterium]